MSIGLIKAVSTFKPDKKIRLATYACRCIEIRPYRQGIYIVALCMGKVDLSALQGLSLVSLPDILPYKPVFNLSAIVSVTMIFLVSATETIGDTSAMTNTVLGREATDREISAVWPVTASSAPCLPALAVCPSPPSARMWVFWP